ncbi:HAD family hydrolase [Campylobacter sp. 19-13652]|uniref:HAD family hydrolase n=1 Tax=Campylobacter sp. 19-13652 TaxID=2840180 RepID=UPI001C75DAAF|nr:HAD family hydrolase [Campylobacter sp. 19-13652]BCX79200.1 haloacid dehalogenase [Campylobacter sp. 19-13652]
MRVVVFDMDGTVLDSADAIAITVNEARMERGLAPLSVERIITDVNTPGKNLALEFYGIDEPNAKFKDLFEDKFRKNYELYARPFKGMGEFLSKLKKDGMKVAMASNAPASTLEEILRRGGIYELFDVIIGASDTMPQKPDPAMVLEAMRLTNASEAIFLGDSLKDEGAAKAAKVPYMQVCWGLADPSASAEYNANTLDEAYGILHNLK